MWTPRYFASFQFKRQRQFINQLHLAPAHLADRIEGLFSADDDAAAVSELEQLVAVSRAFLAYSIVGARKAVQARSHEKDDHQPVAPLQGTLRTVQSHDPPVGAGIGLCGRF